MSDSPEVFVSLPLSVIEGLLQAQYAEGVSNTGSPNHGHTVPGKWDGDREHAPGSDCEECAHYVAIRKAVREAKALGAEPARWGAPSTVGELIRQLSTLDPGLRPVSLQRMPADFRDGKHIQALHLSTSYERVKDGRWLAPYKDETNPRVVAFWVRQDRESVIAAPPTVGGKYAEVLDPFIRSMVKELHANEHKGDRPGWLSMPADTCILEILYHLGKLQRAVKDSQGAEIVEYATDVANLCMMLVDICGGLALCPSDLPTESDKDTHTEHCCSKHGCKYGDEDCTVVSGVKSQSGPCEQCVTEGIP